MRRLYKKLVNFGLTKNSVNGKYIDKYIIKVRQFAE